MKKLFLLLILSFFSTQGYAGLSTNTGSWNVSNPLDKLTIPDNWQLFKNKQALEYTRKKHKALTSPRADNKEGYNPLCLRVVKDWGKCNGIAGFYGWAKTER